MKPFRYIHCFFGLFLLTSSLCFCSCEWMTAPGHYYYLQDSYQICNTSPAAVSLRFEKEEKPYSVYAEIYNQPDPVIIPKDKAIKKVTELLHVTELQLKSGQTAVFYCLTGTREGNEIHKASCLKNCGYGGGLVFYAVGMIGDYVTFSVAGEQDTTVSMNDPKLWQTWYDEKNFIYYHFWQIE